MNNILSKETNKKGFHMIIKNRFKTNDLKSLRFYRQTLCQTERCLQRGTNIKTCVNNPMLKTDYVNYSACVQNCSKKTNLKTLHKIKLTSRQENYVLPTASNFNFTCVNTHSHYKDMKYKYLKTIDLTINVKSKFFNFNFCNL